MGRKQRLDIDVKFDESQMEMGSRLLKMAGDAVLSARTVRVTEGTEKIVTETANWLRHAADVLDARVREFGIRKAHDQLKAMR